MTFSNLSIMTKILGCSADIFRYRGDGRMKIGKILARISVEYRLDELVLGEVTIINWLPLVCFLVS